MYNCQGLAEFYHKVGTELLLNGETANPRGKETKELLHCSFKIVDPRNRLAYHSERKFSLLYAIIESLMLVQPTKELKYFSNFNSKMREFSDDGVHLNGAYGMRVGISIYEAINKIRNDKDTRQCIIPILNYRDIINETKDIPCTTNLHFMIRNNKLDLHVHMRSSDIIWGIPYDVFMFTMLQEILANTLQIDVGNYYYTSNSLHVYKQHYGMLEKMSEGCNSFKNYNFSNLANWIVFGKAYMDWVDDENTKFLISPANIYQAIVANEMDNVYINGLDNIDPPPWLKVFMRKWEY